MQQDFYEQTASLGTPGRPTLDGGCAGRKSYAPDSPAQGPSQDTVQDTAQGTVQTMPTQTTPSQTVGLLQLHDAQGKPLEIDDPSNTIVVGAATWCDACGQFKQLLRSPALAEALDGLRLVFAFDNEFDNEIGAAISSDAGNPAGIAAGIAGVEGVQNQAFLEDLPGEVAFLGPNSVRPDSFPLAFNPATGQFDFSAKKAIKAWLAVQARSDAPAVAPAEVTPVGVASLGPATQVAASHSGGLVGDYNDDHFVDAGDLSVWEQNYGSTQNLDADGDQDGDVDGNDFLVWQRSFGFSLQTAQEHVVFITNSTFNVNAAAEPDPFGTSFGGLSSADFHCTQAASIAGLIAGWNGTDRIYRALISTSSVNASERMFIEDRIVNTNGDIVALDGDDLWDGNLDVAVNYNEFGQLLLANSIFWTGSNANGIHSQSCQNWTQISGQVANVGLSQVTNSWFNQAQLTCGDSYRLVCISPAQDQSITDTAGVLQFSEDTSSIDQSPESNGAHVAVIFSVATPVATPITTPIPPQQPPLSLGSTDDFVRLVDGVASGQNALAIPLAATGEDSALASALDSAFASLTAASSVGLDFFDDNFDDDDFDDDNLARSPLSLDKVFSAI